MTFKDIFKQFTESTKENFPEKLCIIQDQYEPNVYNSKTPFLGLVYDEYKENAMRLDVLYPYICKETSDKILFGWIDKDGGVYGNIENSARLDGLFVVGFQEFESKEEDNIFFVNIIKKIDGQWE